MDGEKAEDGKIVLPQIFYEQNCCGDYLDFLNAIEHEELQFFLKQASEQQFDVMVQDKFQQKEDKQLTDKTEPGKLSFSFPCRF